MLRSGDEPAKMTSRMLWAWAAMAFSMLIKPQGALVGVILIAFAFVPVDPEVRRKRLIATAIGLVLSLVMAYLVALLFHPVGNPIAAFSWLLDRYRIGSAVYPYNSVNAFNLYAIKQSFWSPDTDAAAVLRRSARPDVAVGRRAGPRGGGADRRALSAREDGSGVRRGLDAAGVRVLHRSRRACTNAIASARFSSRFRCSHSAGAGFGRSAILTFTTLLNLVYSFAYQTVMETHPAGRRRNEHLGRGSHILAAINVALFFVARLRVSRRLGRRARYGRSRFRACSARRRARGSIRAKASSRCGRLDWLWAGLFTIGSFILCRLWLQYPDEKIFDEIYYARAGEEYLKHLEIFEFTHPPLTKLVVTLSMILHGGLATGDSGIGWRFLNVVVGALMVGVLYLFAKRLTGSSLFAAIASGMLLFDGFHYVQSRIATPEITVAFFSLTTVYAFYRVWTASASRRASVPTLSRPNITLYAIVPRDRSAVRGRDRVGARHVRPAYARLRTTAGGIDRRVSVRRSDFLSRGALVRRPPRGDDANGVVIRRRFAHRRRQHRVARRPGRSGLRTNPYDLQPASEATRTWSGQADDLYDPRRPRASLRPTAR